MGCESIFSNNVDIAEADSYNQKQITVLTK